MDTEKEYPVKNLDFSNIYEHIQAWYSEVASDEEMSASAFSTLWKKLPEIKNIIRICGDEGMEWEKDVTVWDEIIFHEKTTSNDSTGQVYAMSINRMIESLTSGCKNKEII